MNMFYYIYSFFLFLAGVSMMFLSLYFMSIGLSIFMDWEIFTLNSVVFSVSLIFDYMSFMFMSCVMFISSMVILYSHVYMYEDDNKYRFLILVFLFILSMMFMIISPNMFSILLGWDGLGLVSYCLVIYFQNNKSYNSGMLTIIVNRVGDVCILMCISWMINFGSFNFVFYMNYYDVNMNMIYILIIIAGFTKSAQIPFSSWLPAAMAAPTPVSSLVHSSTLVTAGVYMMIRFSKILFNFNCDFFVYISMMTMFMSGLGANFEFDLKKIIALSTLSQLGLMMAILFLGFPDLAFFHLLTHAFFKSLLFLCSGLIIHVMYDSQDIREMGFVSMVLPYTSSGFIICSFSLSGVPFLSGFYSKDLILEMLFMSGDNMFLYIIFIVSIVFTVAYSFRLMNYLMVNNSGNYCFQVYYEDFMMMFSMIVLMGFSIFFGGLMFSLMFFTPYIFISSFMVKLIPLMLLFIGVFTGMIFYYYKFSMGYKLLNLFCFFSGSMWFMYNFNTYFFYSYGFKLSKNYSNILSVGWGEYIFSKSLINFMLMISKMNFFIEMNNLKLMMTSFFFIMLFMMI